jgi:hypothetical protein
MVLHQPPRLDDNADHSGNQRPDAKGDAARPEVGEVVGRADHVGGQVGRQRRQAEPDQSHEVQYRAAKT